MDSKPPVQDASFYEDGVKKMVSEGLEVVSKIMAFMKLNAEKMVPFTLKERKEFVIAYDEAFAMFNQVHPIVFQYIVSEGIFNQRAFKRYVTHVFGRPRDPAIQAKVSKDPKYMYYYKNEQHALYYKYLMIEANPKADKKIINSMYDEVVQTLNADAKKMLDAYEKAQEEAKVTESRLTEEKRKELVQLLKNKMNLN